MESIEEEEDFLGVICTFWLVFKFSLVYVFLAFEIKNGFQTIWPCKSFKSPRLVFIKVPTSFASFPFKMIFTRSLIFYPKIKKSLALSESCPFFKMRLNYYAHIFSFANQTNNS